jgi:hypothetical protein
VTSTQPLLQRRGAASATAVAVALTAVRLLLATTQRPHYFLLSPADDGQYVMRAMMFVRGSWASSFDQYTFIRGPLYSLYLAAVSRSGFALPFVDVVLQLLVSWWLSIEISRLLRLDRVGLVGVYLALFFLPIIETVSGSHVLRDNFALLLLMAVVAVGLRALRTRSPWWTVATAFGTALMGILREDAIWLAPWAVAVIVVFVVRRWRERPEAPGARPVVLVSAAVVMGAAVLAWLPGAVVAEINSRSGLDSVTLFEDPHFVDAHQAIVRYINDGTENPFTLDPTMLESLVRRSPAMAEMSGGFVKWQLQGNVVYTDAVRFAMATALSDLGVIADPARRSDLLDRLTDQLNVLCDEDHRPSCDAFTGPPPIPVVHLADLVHATFRPFTGLRELFFVEGPPPPEPGTDGPESLLRDWERITNTSPAPGGVVITDGWVHFVAPPSTVSGVVVRGYLQLGRIISPLVRIAGVLSAVVLVRRRRWKVLALGLALLGCAYVRAAQVALAERYLVGDYDYHYVQLAALLVHLAAIVWLAAALAPTSAPSASPSPSTSTQEPAP